METSGFENEGRDVDPQWLFVGEKKGGLGLLHYW